MRKSPILLILCSCALLHAPQRLHSQTDLESIKPCATDPTYKYFEQIQKNQYTQHPDKLGYLKSDPASWTGVISDLRKRPSSISGKPTIDVEDEQKINEFLKTIKPPTCYESRPIYWLIANYAKDIETARKELKLALDKPPKFGSLPTAEINAYTYPAAGDNNSVIAFNTQLFMFDYQLAKAVLPSLGVSLDPSRKYVVVRNDPEFTRAYLAAHPEVKGDFASSVLEFINFAPAHEHSVDQAYDAFILALTFGMESFAVAHEYSHVIHKDHSVVSSLRLELGDEGRPSSGQEPPKAQTVPVLARSWQQELSADELGARLLVRTVQDNVNRDKSELLYSRARLHGPLFFFTCMELTDRARYIAENGKLPPVLTTESKKYIYELADGKASDSDPLFAHLGLTNHPPAWLRRERVSKILEPYLTVDATDEGKMSLVADLVVRNTDLMWNLVEPHMNDLLQAVALGWSRSLKREDIHAVMQGTLICSDDQKEEGLCLNVLADTFRDVKQYQDALVLTDLARIEGASTQSVENSEGRVYSELGQFETARGHYEASLKAGRVDGWPEMNMALDFSDEGKDAEAETYFKSAIARKSTARSEQEFAEYLNGFAWFLITKRKDKIGTIKEATELSEEAVRLTDNKNGNILDTLAACRFAEGRVDDAIATQRKAIDVAQVNGDSAHLVEFTSRLEEYKNASKSH